MSMIKTKAKFNVGQVISHKLFDYRGVIIDVDASFQGSDEWYETRTSTRPPKDEPWYHVLVDRSDQQTYVAERNLQNDDSDQPIEHPMIEELSLRFNNGHYQSSQSCH